MRRIVVGITGTLGAGKGAVVDHLIRAHGFAHFSVRAWLTNIIAERGLRVDRDNMTHVARKILRGCVATTTATHRDMSPGRPMPETANCFQNNSPAPIPAVSGSILMPYRKRIPRPGYPS